MGYLQALSILKVNKLTKRKDITTLSIAISRAPKISIFINVGAILGGIDTKPPNSIKSRNIYIKKNPAKAGFFYLN